MKFYSEILNKLYDSKDELVAAEIEHVKAEEEKKAAEEKKRAEKEKRHNEVAEALKIAKTAERNANKLLNAYVKDYGTFTHKYTEETDGDNGEPWFYDIFSLLRDR